jgi:hypothetical protein
VEQNLPLEAISAGLNLVWTLILLFLARYAPGVVKLLQNQHAHNVVQRALQFATSQIYSRVVRDGEETKTDLDLAAQITDLVEERVPGAVSQLKLDRASLANLALSRIDDLRLRGFSE